MERAPFLAAVRARLSGERLADVTIPRRWDVDVGAPVERFEEELTAVGAHFRRAPLDGAAATLGAILSGRAAPKVLVTREDGVPEGVDEAVRRAGGEVLWWPEAGRAGAAEADVGVTAAAWAVAETGTVVVASTPPGGRAPSLLPPAFCCFVPETRVLPTVKVLFERIAGAPRDASNIVLVTGPSKSADIGLELTQGVHGPGEVHAIVVEGA